MAQQIFALHTELRERCEQDSRQDRSFLRFGSYHSSAARSAPGLCSTVVWTSGSSSLSTSGRYESELQMWMALDLWDRIAGKTCQNGGICHKNATEPSHQKWAYRLA